MILAAFAIGGPAKCSELDIVQYDAEKLAGELGERFHLLEQADETHKTPAGQYQIFSCFCFRREYNSYPGINDRPDDSLNIHPVYDH